MKPRTKLQMQVIELSKHLHCRYKELLPWATKECLVHRGFATKSRVICMECGERFSTELVKRKKAVCPHCNAKINVEQTRKTTFKQRTYFAFAEIYGEFQVIRNFELFSYHKAGEQVRHFCWEILQHWVLPNGKYETVAKNHTINWYCDSWNGDMEIRKNYSRYYYNSNRYDVYPQKYHPESEFKPMYKLYGIDYRLRGLSFLEAINIIPQNPIAETLLKTKQYGFLGAWDSNGNAIRRYWPTMKICFRNKYKIKDITMFFDYLDLLVYFGKDLHNAKYVCPADLKREHDRLVAKKQDMRRRQEIERKKKKAIEDEKKFRALKEKFFGIEFSDGTISIRVLDNVLDFVEEGDKLHHCVFTNGYHLKPDSLILSARIKGEPIETIEVSLKTLKIVQCQGKFNENSEYHKQILTLVKKNMKLIRQRISA